MLTDKTWQSEAILRLALSVIVCAFLGGLAMASLRMGHAGQPEKLPGFAALAVGAALFGGGALFVLRRPWELDRFTRSFTALLVCIYLCLTLGAFAINLSAKSAWNSQTWQTIISGLSFHAASLVLITRFLKLHQTSWPQAFGLRHQGLLAVTYGFLLACTFLPLGWLLQQASFKLLALAHYAPKIQPAVQALQDTASRSDRSAIFVVVVLFAPLVEETLFRGILYPAIKQAGHPRFALWFTSVFFAGVHFHVASFLSLLLFALLLTWIYERAQNLLAPIAAHAVFNGFNFLTGIYQDEIVRLLERTPTAN